MIRLIVVRLPRGPDPARGPEPGAPSQGPLARKLVVYKSVFYASICMFKVLLDEENKVQLFDLARQRELFRNPLDLSYTSIW